MNSYKFLGVKMLINNETVTVAPDGSVTVEAPQGEHVFEYDEDGWSTVDKYGVCRRNKFVDDFLEDKLANGEPWEKTVAKLAPRWFAIWRKEDNLTEEQQTMFLRSYRQNKFVYGAGAMVGVMYVLGFYPTATSELNNKTGYPDKAEGCAIPIFGFRPDYAAEVFVSKYIRMLRRDMNREKNKGVQVGTGNWEKKS